MTYSVSLLIGQPGGNLEEQTLGLPSIGDGELRHLVTKPLIPACYDKVWRLCLARNGVEQLNSPGRPRIHRQPAKMEEFIFFLLQWRRNVHVSCWTFEEYP